MLSTHCVKFQRKRTKETYCCAVTRWSGIQRTNQNISTELLTKGCKRRG